jgi:ABC-type multidrug transport system permease subunit
MLAANDLINAQWRSSRSATSPSAESAEQTDPTVGESGPEDPDVASEASTQTQRSRADAEVRLPAVGPLLLAASATANGLGATPVVLVTRNGPAPSNSSWLAPGLVALISTFVAFLAGASSLAREGEQGTLHWLLAATRSSWLEVGAAKVIVATFLGAVTLLALILFNWLGLDQAVNPDIAAVLPSQLLSLLVAAMQGVAVSALVGRQDQAFLISGAYLILLSLFSGVFMPVAGSGGPAEFISWLLPTTFSQTGLVDWMQRDSAGWDGSVLISLGMLLVGTTLLWLTSLRVLATRQ